jgi:single-strand DNA-binding protein
MSNFFVNSVVISGNMVAPAELRKTKSDISVANLTVAVNERRKNGDEWEDVPTFVDVTVWGFQAELASERGGKGAPVIVEGRLTQDKWVDAEGGNRSKLKITGEKFIVFARQGKPEEPVTVGTSAPGQSDEIPWD